MTITPKMLIEDGPAMMPVHSPLYALSASKRLFLAATSLSGKTIPVNASGLVSVFTLENPAASTVSLELVRLKLAAAGTTAAVIGNIGLAYQNPLTALSTTTIGTITSSIIGLSVSSQAVFYTAGTFTGTPTVLEAVMGFGTTSAAPGPVVAQADLTGLILPPGAAVTLVGNVAQTQPMAVSLLFAENPTY